MKKQLFEYVAIYNPKPTKDASGNDTTPPSKVLVKGDTLQTDPDKAAIVAHRSIPDDYVDKLDEIDVTVRPF